MTNDLVLQALLDLVQQCEKDKCSFSDMRPYTAAMEIIRAHVYPGGLEPHSTCVRDDG